MRKSWIDDISPVLDNRDIPLLYWAIMCGYTRLTRYLLIVEQASYPDILGFGDLTPLGLAICCGQDAVVRMILNSRDDCRFAPRRLDCHSRTGDTLLHYVAQRGNKTTVQLLLESGHFDIDVCDNSMQSPLHYALSHDHVKVVEALINHGASIEKRNHLWLTPLHIAAERGNVAMLRLLVDSGANIEATDHRGFTPLMSAAYQEHGRATAYLLESFHLHFGQKGRWESGRVVWTVLQEGVLSEYSVIRQPLNRS